MTIKSELDNLKTQDIYSLLLFALFRFRSIPEYSTLSELVYILDKENLLKLCEYFGGLTLKIPTIEELETMVYALTLYQKVKIDKMSLNEAIQLVGCPKNLLSQAKEDYFKLDELLQNYNFNGGNDVE